MIIYAPPPPLCQFLLIFFCLISTFSVSVASLETLQGQKLNCSYLYITNVCIYFYSKCE